MNKTAVALAADSAVTISHGNGEKVYNSVNKLFSLSEYHPVGIMIYGSAELMEMPWETIIKMYRKELGARKFDTLKEYQLDFVAYLEKSRLLFPASAQEEYYFMNCARYLSLINGEIKMEVKKLMQSGDKLSDNDIKKCIADIIDKHFQLWTNAKFREGFSGNFSKRLKARYKKAFDKARVLVFEKLPLTEAQVATLVEIISSTFCKGMLPESELSGVVIAGFGDQEPFPSVYAMAIQGIVCDKIQYKLVKERSIEIGKDAFIIPFAQGEMVATFMEGVDPGQIEAINGFIEESHSIYSNFLKSQLGGLANLKELEKALEEASRQSKDELKNKMKAYREEYHINPIMNTVKYLPKDELAAMAESLVHLAALKRKITLNAESVGGPIDVAVISKGDGFIWIKRKHYFRADLNMQFSANYNKEPKGGG